jgi:hypothetical protein
MQISSNTIKQNDHMVRIWACLKREAASEHDIAGYPQRKCGTPEYTHLISDGKT